MALDISDMLSQFMVDNWPDEALFQKAVSPVMVEALSASTSKEPRVMVCGECAPTLWREGKGDAALRVEQLWDKTHAGAWSRHALRLPAGFADVPGAREDGPANLRRAHRSVFDLDCCSRSAVQRHSCMNRGAAARRRSDPQFSATSFTRSSILTRPSPVV